MAWKIIEWNAENNKQRFQTAFTFIRAGFKMIKNKKAALRINITNLNDGPAILYDRNRG